MTSEDTARPAGALRRTVTALALRFRNAGWRRVLPLALSVLLSLGVAWGGVSAAETVSFARDAVSGQGSVLPDMASFRQEHGYLPDAAGLRVEAFLPLPLRSPRVVLRDTEGGGIFTVTMQDGRVTGIAAGGSPETLAEVTPYSVVAAPAPRMWQVASWPAQAYITEPEPAPVATATPVARGVSIAALPATPTVLSSPAAPAAKGKPGTAKAVVVATPDSTGTLLLQTTPPVQYSVMDMPGTLRTVPEAQLIADEWLAMTAELAERTGYQVVATATMPVAYDDQPALVGYASYQLDGRTRTHRLLVVFLPDSNRLVLVASQDETGTPTASSVATATPAEGDTGSLPATVAGLPSMASTATLPVPVDPLAFARSCRLVLSP